MPRPMRRRLVLRALDAARCTFVREGAEHTVYACPCGQHKTAVPRHTDVTAGVIGSIIKQLPCLPKGWLQ